MRPKLRPTSRPPGTRSSDRSARRTRRQGPKGPGRRLSHGTDRLCQPDDRHRGRWLRGLFPDLEPRARCAVPAARAACRRQHQPGERDPALAVPVSGDLHAGALSALSGGLFGHPVADGFGRRDICRAGQLCLSGARREVSGKPAQQPLVACRRAGGGNPVRAAGGGADRPAEMGCHGAKPDLHADGDLVCRRGGDLEVHL